MDTSDGQFRMLVDSTKIGGGEISEAEKNEAILKKLLTEKRAQAERTSANPE